MIPAKTLRASGEGGRKRDSSRRSPAMVRIRNAIHSGATAGMANPASHNALPAAQLAAPSASVRVCSARWRRYTCSDPATMIRLPANSSAGPVGVPKPASSASPPRPARQWCAVCPACAKRDGPLKADDGAEESTDHQRPVIEYGCSIG